MAEGEATVRGIRKWCLLPAAALGLAGCVSDRLTEPGQSATEQLLISTAVDQAVEQLNPNLRAGTKVFVDPQYYDNAPGDAALYTKYAIASIRDRLLRLGIRLVDDRKVADVVAEVRTGAQSIDHHEFLIGIPSIPVPIPTTSEVAKTPKLALYDDDKQTGVAKIAVTAVGRDGSLAGSSGPAFGESHERDVTLLLFISWNRQDIMPQSDR
jgi:hypothetical protein